MSEVLYRKYRSQSFDELVGQSHITDILKNAVKSDSLSHAYLLVGSRGTGKTSTARILAKAINCTSLTKDGNPCNQCDTCKSITDGRFLDLIEIDAASNRGIDQIRELKERIEYAPNEGKYKIYIIDEVHMLTTEAFNALLKTLEEPPAHVVFILATTDVHKLPATILSRCQRYDFRLGTDEQIAAVIQDAAVNEGVKLSDGALRILVQNANGSYRDSLSLLDVVVTGQSESKKPDEVSEAEVRQSLGVPDSTMVYYLLEKLVHGEGVEALKLINELDSKGVNLQQFVKFVLLSLREILLNKIQNINEEEFTFANEMTENTVLRYINLFLDAERKLRTATMPALILEMVIAEILISINSKSSNSVAKSAPASKSPAAPPEKSVAKIAPKVEAVAKKASVAKASKPAEVTKELPSDVSVKVEVESVSEPKLKTEKEAKSKSAAKGSVSMEKINEAWPEITTKIQKFNNHLYAFMKAAKVVGVEGNALVLEVPFEFHKDRIESPTSREAVNDIFQDVLGSKLSIRCDVNEAIQRKKPTSADIVLKNIQSTVKQVDEVKTTAPASAASYKKPPANGERKVSKKVEAIFADL